MKSYFNCYSPSRPVGRGGSRGFARTPLLASKRFCIHCFNCTF